MSDNWKIFLQMVECWIETVILSFGFLKLDMFDKAGRRDFQLSGQNIIKKERM